MIIAINYYNNHKKRYFEIDYQSKFLYENKQIISFIFSILIPTQALNYNNNRIFAFILCCIQLLLLRIIGRVYKENQLQNDAIYLLFNIYYYKFIKRKITMSFGKKPIVMKGKEKPQKPLLQQIQDIMGSKYTSEEIQSILEKTQDINEAIRLLKLQKDYVDNNSQNIKMQMLQKQSKQPTRVLKKFDIKWHQEQMYDEDKINIDKMIQGFLKLAISDQLLNDIKSNFSIPSKYSDQQNNK
ncbi:hypothetical protein pb186bvf_000607 [Paramecium bursaria]